MPHLITPALHAVVDLLAKIAAKRHDLKAATATQDLAKTLSGIFKDRSMKSCEVIADRMLRAIDVHSRSLDKGVVAALHVLVDDRDFRAFGWTVTKLWRKTVKKVMRDSEIIYSGGLSPALN